MPWCSIYIPLRLRDLVGEGKLNIYGLGHTIITLFFPFDRINFINNISLWRNQ